MRLWKKVDSESYPPSVHPAFISTPLPCQRSRRGLSPWEGPPDHRAASVPPSAFLKRPCSQQLSSPRLSSIRCVPSPRSSLPATRLSCLPSPRTATAQSAPSSILAFPALQSTIFFSVSLSRTTINSQGRSALPDSAWRPAWNGTPVPVPFRL